LQELTPKVLAREAHLFTVQPAVAFRQRSSRAWDASRSFVGTNPPFGASIYFHLKSGYRPGNPFGDPHVVITDSLGKKVTVLKLPEEDIGKTGLYRVVWNLRGGGALSLELMPPGDYVATLHANGQAYQQKLRVDAEE